MLGAEGHADRGGADQRAATPEHSRAIDLETGHTRMLEVETVDAASTIRLMIALLTMYPRKRVIHLFLDNARYHHAKLVQAWLARPGCRIRLHFIPTYCPHLDPIE